MVAAAALVATGFAAWVMSGGMSGGGAVTDSSVKRGLIVTKSPDSLAPKGAPAHWLPPEDWVYNHWLPNDETRLYSLLGITRLHLWHQ
jgi:hypothetical protein